MTDIQDAAGNPLGAILAWGFTTQPPVTVIPTQGIYFLADALNI